MVCWWTTFLSYSQISSLGHSSKMECYDWCVWTCQFWELKTFGNYFPKCSLKVFSKARIWFTMNFSFHIFEIYSSSHQVVNISFRVIPTYTSHHPRDVCSMSYLLTLHILQYLRNHIFLRWKATCMYVDNKTWPWIS